MIYLSSPPQSAAYRFAKQYDCMDMPNAHDPSNGGDAAPGTFDSASNSEAGTRDMVATLDTVKPLFRDFEGKSEPTNGPQTFCMYSQYLSHMGLLKKTDCVHYYTTINLVSCTECCLFAR